MIQPISSEYDKRAYYRAVDDRYERAFRAARDNILRRVDLKRDHRRELLTETGMETTGPGAMYHFKDVGYDLNSAAWCLSGAEPGYRPCERPRVALVHVGDTFGWRYVRGLQALHDGLVEAGVPSAERNRLRQHCNEFEDVFRLRLHAAYMANDKGKYPALAGEVLTMFVDHMQGLYAWIEMTSERNTVRAIEMDLQRAAAYLREVPDSYDARHNSRRTCW